MQSSYTPSAESHAKAHHPEGPVAAIERRTRLVRTSLRIAEIVVVSGRETEQATSDMMRRIYPTPLSQELIAKPNLPAVPEQATQEVDTNAEEQTMNPILLQARVDGLAKTTEEGKNDFKETA
jgi:hypothetical protein